jgi:hypothetical protein
MLLAQTSDKEAQADEKGSPSVLAHEELDVDLHLAEKMLGVSLALEVSDWCRPRGSRWRAR